MYEKKIYISVSVKELINNSKYTFNRRPANSVVEKHYSLIHPKRNERSKVM